MTPLILPFDGKTPRIDATAFIAPGAVIIGDVQVGPRASIWYGCVLRGDMNKIRVGEASNVQDGTIIHVDSARIGGRPCVIGDRVLIGHKCMLHGCHIEDGGFVGMGASVLDHAVVESGGFLAAGAFLGPGKRVPNGEMWAGLPARKFRNMKPGEEQAALVGAETYVAEAARHAAAIKSHAATCAPDKPPANMQKK